MKNKLPYIIDYVGHLPPQGWLLLRSQTDGCVKTCCREDDVDLHFTISFKLACHYYFFASAIFSIDDDILLGENDLNHAFDIWKVRLLLLHGINIGISKLITIIAVLNPKSLLLGMSWVFTPLSHHDALKHHFTSLKTHLISLQLGVLERKFPCNWFTNTWQFSLIFKPHQIIFIHYKSRIAAAIRGL